MKPDDLPFRLEVWSPDGARVDELLALFSHGSIARAAFVEAVRHRPPDRYLVILRERARTIARSGPDGA